MIDLDHNFAKRSNWIIILGNDRFGSFLTKFPQGMIQIDHFRKKMIQIDLFSKKWSNSIILRNYVPNRKTFTKITDLDHCRIWIIDRFGTLSQKWSKSRNDPKPTMIQIRQWSKSMSISSVRCQFVVWLMGLWILTS